MKDLAAFPSIRPRLADIERYRKTAADPDAVVVGLHRILEAGADPLGNLEGWLKLIDTSPEAVETLVQRPALARDIADVTYDRVTFERELRGALDELPDLESRLDHLRSVRVDETLRIAWQDVVDGADLTVITRRISDLAEIVMEYVVHEVNEELAKRFGRAWHDGELFL